MAFLYIGTCQARSESAHPNDAQLKLLSWVSPTPDQSFMTRSVTDVSADVNNLVELKVDDNTTAASGVVGQDFLLEADPDAAIAEIGSNLDHEVALAQMQNAMTVTWYVNGEVLSSGTGTSALQSHFSAEAPGDFQIYAVVTFPGISDDNYPSNQVTVNIGIDGDDEDICAYAWIQDQGATAQELTTTFEAGSEINWEFVVSHGGWTESITWYLDDESSTPIGYDNELNYTLPSSIALGQHTIIPHYTAYDNETFYIYSYGEEPDNPAEGYCPKNITITVTEPTAGPVTGEVSQTDYCAESDIQSNELVDRVITRVPGDDNPISVTLNIDERVTLAGDIQWSFTKTDQYLTVVYDVYPYNNGFSANVDVPEDMGDYDLTATFRIARFQISEGVWDVFSEPYSCPKTITVRVEEPDPCEAAYIVSNGNPVDEIQLHQGEDIVVPLSISDNAAVESVVWETTYPDGIDADDVDAVIYGPSATTAPGEYTVTATINELWGISIGGQWIDFSQPISCPAKQVVIRVLGNDEPTPEPTPTPDEPVWVNIDGNTEVCPDDEVTLIAHVTPEGAAVSNYVWIYQENAIMDAPNVPHTGPVFTFVPSEFFGDSEDRTITVEIAYGECSHPRDSKEIKYLPAAPEIHISVSPEDICVGGQVTATIQAVSNESEEEVDPEATENVAEGVS